VEENIFKKSIGNTDKCVYNINRDKNRKEDKDGISC